MTWIWGQSAGYSDERGGGAERRGWYTERKAGMLCYDLVCYDLRAMSYDIRREGDEASLGQSWLETFAAYRLGIWYAMA